MLELVGDVIFCGKVFDFSFAGDGGIVLSGNERILMRLRAFMRLMGVDVCVRWESVETLLDGWGISMLSSMLILPLRTMP